MSNNITPEERERRTPTEEIQAQFRSARADIERQLENTKAQFEQTRVQFEAANEKIQKRTGRNLLGAIAAGIIFGAFVLVSLLIFKWLFVIFAMVVLGICTLELANAMRVRGWYVPRILSVVVTVITMPGACTRRPCTVACAPSSRRACATARRWWPAPCCCSC